MQHVGIALASIAMAIFVIHYAGRAKWLTWRRVALLALVPGIGLALAWTNEAHHLIWKETHLRIEGSLALLDISYGPYFWFYTAYNYLVLLSGAFVLAQTARHAAYLQRCQAIILLIGVLLPAIVMLVYLSHQSPFPDLDLAPLGWSASGLVVAFGLFRYRLFDRVPIARDKVIETLRDGVLVLDPRNRIVDANPTMLKLPGCSASQVIGKPAAQVLVGPFAAAAPSDVEIYTATRRYCGDWLIPLSAPVSEFLREGARADLTTCREGRLSEISACDEITLDKPDVIAIVLRVALPHRQMEAVAPLAAFFPSTVHRSRRRRRPACALEQA
jgi:PAS domain-containing protein